MTDWPMFGELFIQWLTLTFMLVGLVGMLIPIFPGIVVIWLSAVFYALIAALLGKMTVWCWLVFGLITVLMVFGSFVDNIIIAKKLRETGTPWRSIWIGYVVGLVASLFLTPFAAILATPLALYIAEYLRLRDVKQALASTRGWVIGSSWTLLALMGVGSVMIGLWLMWAWYL